jgi:hypothetical protein
MIYTHTQKQRKQKDNFRSEDRSGQRQTGTGRQRELYERDNRGCEARLTISTK